MLLDLKVKVTMTENSCCPPQCPKYKKKWAMCCGDRGGRPGQHTCSSPLLWMPHPLECQEGRSSGSLGLWFPQATALKSLMWTCSQIQCAAPRASPQQSPTVTGPFLRIQAQPYSKKEFSKTCFKSVLNFKCRNRNTPKNRASVTTRQGFCCP